MDALRAGLQAIARNGRLLVVYIAVSIALTMASGALEWLMIAGPLQGLEDVAKRLLDLVKLLLSAAAYAALNAIVFSMLGADIDRPLWRYKDWQDALKRFFTPWFLLALSYIVLFRIVLWLGDDNPATQLFLMLACMLFTLHLPIGVAIMHQGRFEWRYLGDGLKPLLVQLPRMLIPYLCALYLFFLAMYYSPSIRPSEANPLGWIWRAPLFEIVASIFVFGIVATTWCVLMLHRDESDEDFDM